MTKEDIIWFAGLFDGEGFTTAIDIVTVNSNIELGSYGIGSYENYKWVYGTGLAEPRLSQAKIYE